MLSPNVHSRIFYLAIIFLVISLPYSVFTLSVAQIILVVNWILEGNFREKFGQIKKSPALWVVTIFYIVHLVWMLNTSDFSWGIRELRLKLPMLVLPFVIATSPTLSGREIKGILLAFVAAVFLFTLYSGSLIFGLDGKPFHTMTELSPIIWHIRFALMVVLSIFFLFHIIRLEEDVRLKWIYLGVLGWLVIFLFLFRSLTGIVVFLATATLLLTGKLIHDTETRKTTLIILISLMLAVSGYLAHAWMRFSNFDKIDFSNLGTKTAQRNPYWHDTTKRYVENGHYIYLYICDPELRDEWCRRSRLSFEGRTENNLLVRDCVIRYLTSKGLRKDAQGMKSLSDREIRYIEMGKTNYIDTSRYDLYPRVYVSLWELYSYSQGANPKGYSLAQRIECLKISWHIIRKHFFFGIGTGDIPSNYKTQSELDHSPLPSNEDWWANNQFVTFWVCFGLAGFLLILISLIAPAFLQTKTTDYLFMVVIIVGFLSFLDEDTFETHPGISMFAIFYSIFLFRKHETS